MNKVARNLYSKSIKMRMQTRLLPFVLGLVSLASACGVADESLSADDALRKKVVLKYTAGWGCPDCDFQNSPWLGSFPIEALAYGPYADETRPRIVHAVDPSGEEFPVKIDERGLVAVKPGGDVEGHALIGWSLYIKVPGDQAYDVDIYAYEDVTDWTDNADTIPTFGLSLIDPSNPSDGESVNLCPGMDVDLTSVTFLDGETYDLQQPGGAAATQVSDVATIACRGHALAKMKLLGYDPNSAFTQTSPKERVATLRMVTADYCGDGVSNTQYGTRVDWTDYAGHVMYSSPPMGTEIEAEWTADGASCFNDPRVQNTVPGCTIDPCSAEFSGHDGTSVWTSILP